MPAQQRGSGIKNMNKLFVKGINKIFSFNTCLAADSPQGGRFYSGVIRDSQ